MKYINKKKKVNNISNQELKRMYKKWIKNFQKGIDEILKLPRENQQYLWFCVLNECLYSSASNPFLSQMYVSDGLYDVKDFNSLEDVHLVPMNRSRLIEGMKSYLISSGKKKWTDTLKKIEESAIKEDYL